MIYFIRAGDTGAVKIGYTKNEIMLKSRLGSLQIGSPDKLAVIRVVWAKRSAEAWFHGFFAGLRLAGEWFAYHDDMLSLEPPSSMISEPSEKLKPQQHEEISPKPFEKITSSQARAARTMLGISATELADLAGVSWRTIQRAEHPEGIGSMNVSTLRKIGAALDGAGIKITPDGTVRRSGGPGIRRQP